MPTMSPVLLARSVMVSRLLIRRRAAADSDSREVDVGRDLSRSLSAAALARAGPETRLATAASLGTAAGPARGTGPRESRTAMRTVSVRAVAGRPVAGVPILLHARVAAKMSVSTTLANRELRQAAFFFLSLDTGKLRTDQGPMHGPFLDVRLRIVGLFSGALGVVVIDRCCGRISRRRRDRRRFIFDGDRLVDRLGVRVDGQLRALGISLTGKHFLVESGCGFLL